MAYVDEGPATAPVFLCLHGQPTWSYLYRRMIPHFLAAGGRVVAPDFFGFGRSDKPADDAVYTFDFHRNSLLAFVRALDLKDVTLVVQDWGGLLGLTLPMEMPERFSRADRDEYRAADRRSAVAPRAFSTGAPFPTASRTWRSAELMARACPHLTAAEAAAYDAPYPDASYKAGVRRFPNLVPEFPDSDGAAIERAARDFWRNDLDRTKRHGDRHGRPGAGRAGDARAASRTSATARRRSNSPKPGISCRNGAMPSRPPRWRCSGARGQASAHSRECGNPVEAYRLYVLLLLGPRLRGTSGFRQTSRQVTLCVWVTMAFIRSFAFPDFLNSLVSLFAAFVLGTLIGAERQYRQRGGGLRTHVLVAVGAATFVDIGMRINGNQGATQIIAYVVSGVGFLGAGVIMKQGSNVWGLNTAATLWCSAAVGACAGADLAIEAVALTCFVLAGNTLLRPLVNAINRAPIDEAGTEAIYEVHLRTNTEHRDDARELLREQLEAANYPVKDIEAEDEKDDEVELVATLLGTTGDPDELDAIMARLKANPIVENAGWNLRTTE